MNITETVNRLLKKATDLRLRADHLEAVANDLVIVGDEEFGEGKTDEVQTVKMKKFQELGKTPLDELPPSKVHSPSVGKTPKGRNLRFIQCKYCGTSVLNQGMGIHVRFNCPVLKHNKKTGKTKQVKRHITPEGRRRIQEASRARWVRFRREHGPRLVKRAA